MDHRLFYWEAAAFNLLRLLLVLKSVKNGPNKHDDGNVNCLLLLKVQLALNGNLDLTRYLLFWREGQYDPDFS